MNKEELNCLLDNIYELEGLVHLALAREDCPQSLPELIVRKANSLTQLVNTIGADSQINQSEPEAVSDNAENSEIEINTEIEENDVDGVPEEIVSEEDEECSGNEAVAIVEVNTEVEKQGEDNLHEISDMPDSDILNKVSESEPVAATAIEEIGEPEVDEMDEPAFASYTLPSEKTAPKPHKIVEPRGKLVFTINDRYRFKRDLFCNSDADFNTTLALVASMDSYDEAEDYFLGELQWNPQREEVIDFLEILKNYFK